MDEDTFKKPIAEDYEHNQEKVLDAVDQMICICQMMCKECQYIHKNYFRNALSEEGSKESDQSHDEVIAHFQNAFQISYELMLKLNERLIPVFLSAFMDPPGHETEETQLHHETTEPAHFSELQGTSSKRPRDEEPESATPPKTEISPPMDVSYCSLQGTSSKIPRFEEPESATPPKTEISPPMGISYCSLEGTSSKMPRFEEPESATPPKTEISPPMDISYCSLEGTSSKIPRFEETESATPPKTEFSPPMGISYCSLEGTSSKIPRFEEPESATAPKTEISPPMDISYCSLQGTSSKIPRFEEPESATPRKIEISPFLNQSCCSLEVCLEESTTRRLSNIDSSFSETDHSIYETPYSSKPSGSGIRDIGSIESRVSRQETPLLLQVTEMPREASELISPIRPSPGEPPNTTCREPALREPMSFRERIDHELIKKNLHEMANKYKFKNDLNFPPNIADNLPAEILDTCRMSCSACHKMICPMLNLIRQGEYPIGIVSFQFFSLANCVFKLGATSILRLIEQNTLLIEANTGNVLESISNTRYILNLMLMECSNFLMSCEQVIPQLFPNIGMTFVQQVKESYDLLKYVNSKLDEVLNK
ncbi:hypothetical protein C0J52_18377 [Blattella germanica]|nr:hypothetical protein C0J52_18377 [Blattella germanica]